jgi:CHAT domain-containing protein/Flp pilus assembly protein TadD
MRANVSNSLREAKHFDNVALAVSEQQHDSFREAGALDNLAVDAETQEHYDESIGYGERSLAISQSQGYELYAEKAEGTIAFSYLKIGDFNRALELLNDANRRAHAVDSGSDRIRWPNNLGMIYDELGQLPQAENSYREALAIAHEQGDEEQTTVALAELAYVSIRSGKWEQAEDFAKQALVHARTIKNTPMELEALLAQGLIAAHNGDHGTAEGLLLRVVRDPRQAYDSSLWEAQSQLAALYANEHKIPAAHAEYQVALKTVRDARCSVQKESLRLPFFANATRVYNSYIDFLVEHGKTAEALKTADESRALTLAEGLGIGGKKCLAAETAFDPQRTARAANATILFYWLGAEHSHLWAVAPDRVKHYSLPPATQIDSAVEAYRKALLGSRDVLQSGDTNGAMLYQTLAAPAEEFFRPGSGLPETRVAKTQSTNQRIIVIADGSLSGLNFETLIAPNPQPHYWIEDVCVENASSLRLMAARPGRRGQSSGKLLLIGDPVPPKGSDFEALPNAAREMQSVRKHFSDASQTVYEQRGSTPVAYIGSHPEQFAYIHFVAHGVASETDPLDSAVVLSPAMNSAPAAGQVKGLSSDSAPDKDGGYKLYARDVMNYPLTAELVTVSACKGAGVRTYTGEGLVGLSWAFLHAGAHHVIGALWDVSDESTPLLMSAMYDELVKGSPPEAALRTAKLSLLHSGAPFRKPYYWAPFQLYTGS